jgi:hypothetical protein
VTMLPARGFLPVWPAEKIAPTAQRNSLHSLPAPNSRVFPRCLTSFLHDLAAPLRRDTLFAPADADCRWQSCTLRAKEFQRCVLVKVLKQKSLGFPCRPRMPEVSHRETLVSHEQTRRPTWLVGGETLCQLLHRCFSLSLAVFRTRFQRDVVSLQFAIERGATNPKHLSRQRLVAPSLFKNPQDCHPLHFC